MRKHPAEWSPATRYVVVYPQKNVSYDDAVKRYAGLLKPGDNSFAYFTIEAVLDAAFAHGGPTRARFTERYLW